MATTLRHAATAVARRNASRTWQRRIDWRPARASLWALLERHVARGARVAIVGIGHGDDIPLRKLARRAGSIDLFDVDAVAMANAVRRMRGVRCRVTTTVEDITCGASDSIVARATGSDVEIAYPPHAPLGRGDYDVVIGDLLYTQLLHPALSDTGLPRQRVDKLMLQHGQRVTDGVVARMHVSAPVVVHLHDLLGWWPGNQQRFSMDEVLALPTDRALALASTGSLPYGADPRVAAERAGARIVETAFWRWNFGAGKQFLVCATVARSRS